MIKPQPNTLIYLLASIQKELGGEGISLSFTTDPNQFDTLWIKLSVFPIGQEPITFKIAMSLQLLDISESDELLKESIQDMTIRIRKEMERLCS